MARRKKRAESRARYFLRQQAQARGWNVSHPSRGGEVLEEQEIEDYFPESGLGLERPDFMFVLNGNPAAVIETKNDISKLQNSIDEAIAYAELINKKGKYSINVAVGAAGEENHGFGVCVMFLKRDEWIPLTANGYELSATPSKREVELAMIAGDGTTVIEVPSVSEFIDSAIELSRILRLAKVEAPLRPKVIGALTLAMYQGEIITAPDEALESINSNVSEAVKEAVDLTTDKKGRLVDALKLQGGDYDRLAPHIGRVSSILKQLNIRAVLQTDTDFLGIFYEAFLRYGYDNNALGIVFTPRHITNFCADLVGLRATDRVVDLASGTGGFLVAAFDRMLKTAHGPKAIQKVKNSLYGFDTNPTIWALSTLNMFFRGDGKTHIENASCFDEAVISSTEGNFTRAFLNPPFSQEGEPERDFIDRSMSSLEPEGLFAVVVKAGIFADDDNKQWRHEFTRNHTVLAIISLPEDLFYPTAAPTSILIARAHIPHSGAVNVFLGRVSNDGFEKLKGRRVAIPGSEIPSMVESFHNFFAGSEVAERNCLTIPAETIREGEEWSPQKWLPQPELSFEYITQAEANIRYSLFKALTSHQGLADATLEDFGEDWSDLDELPYGTEEPIEDFFEILNGKSSGEKNYIEGTIPYISSGDTTNSIIRLITAEEEEVFPSGGITVTAFGQACVQPWPFMARGNGGSAVRVLIPKFRMSIRELIWFVAQINLQRWRFFYGRMAIKSRISKLIVKAPETRMEDTTTLYTELVEFDNYLKSTCLRI